MHVRDTYAHGVVHVSEVWCDGDAERETDDEESLAAEVVLPHAGVFVRHVEGRRMVGHAAVAVFYNRDDVSRVAHPAGGNDASTVLRPTEAVLESLVGRAGTLPSVAVPLDGEAMVSAARLRRLLSRPSPGEGLAADELAMRVVAAAVRVPHVRPSVAATERQLRIADHVAQYLAWRYRDDLGLAELAAATGASPFEVSRAVNRTTGRSIVALRTGFRLHHVLHHIDDDGAELAALAVAAGFADQAHMTRTFRRHLGSTPATVRRHLTGAPRKVVQDSR